MVRIGTVISVNKAEKSGIIRDKNGRQFFFGIHECVGNELPHQFELVMFERDPDFKTFNVAMLIQRAAVPPVSGGALARTA